MGEAERRLGRFRVSRTLLDKNWRLLKPLFENVVPVYVENRFHEDSMEYVAYSELFEVVPEGIRIPEYEFVFGKKKDGTVSILRVEKIQELRK